MELLVFLEKLFDKPNIKSLNLYQTYPKSTEKQKEMEWVLFYLYIFNLFFTFIIVLYDDNIN